MIQAASKAALRVVSAHEVSPRPEDWHWCVHETWLGPLLLCASARGLVCAGLGVEDPGERLVALARRGGRHVRCHESSAHLAAASSQLDEYFSARRAVLDLPLDAIGSPFELRVWEHERGIPRGATRTYGEVARALGMPGAARAVGGATGRNPLLLFVPCHRVLSSTGLGGFSAPGGTATKARLLRFEGAIVGG